MGGITSRINFDGLHSGGQRSQEGEPLYSYSMNKIHFSNYFFMGGERFEVNDPDYLFGDSCDLNFLSCSKPYSLPYRRAQQNLIANLNSKQKNINKVSGRVNIALTSPLNILTCGHEQSSNCQKQDAQTQTLNNASKSLSNCLEPSRPLVMLINIRKETLRLVKSSNFSNTDDLSNPGSVESSKSGYTSVKDVLAYCASDDDDKFEDALNDPTYLSGKDDAGDDDVEQGQKCLAARSTANVNCDTRIPITSRNDDLSDKSDDEVAFRLNNPNGRQNTGGVVYVKKDSNRHRVQTKNEECLNTEREFSIDENFSNRVYNIEFQFDAEVDCSIRIFYFCTRELHTKGVTYKPQHATYKSKTYVYKKGLGQKFEQQEHTFQPHLFDEDLLIYKPLDMFGNYNSGAVLPIVIHCVALDGPHPRQSQSLVATVEKSQMDESYSLKPLKQLIFVDGVQYILQDIYGIENKAFSQSPKSNSARNVLSRKQTSRRNPIRSSNLNSPLCSSTISIGSTNLQPFSDTASIASGIVIEHGVPNDTDDEDAEKDSLYSVATANDQQVFRSITSENNSIECVICMSEERDTMLLPCRHLCICSSCAQSLRYQANSCPICRCPFKAALNLRIVQFKNLRNRRLHKQD